MVDIFFKNRLILILCISLISHVYSLNPIHNARYQIYPEIFIPNQGFIGTGISTHFNGDASIPVSFKFGLNKVEFGAKVSHNRYNTMKNANTIADVGMKFRLSDYQTLQTDIVFGLGSSGHEGVAIGYSALRKYTNKVFALFEGRMAFFDGLKSGNAGIFAQELGAYPEIRLGNNLKLILGFSESFTVGYFDTIKETFSIDMIPIITYKIGPTHIFFDITMGIKGSEESDFRYAFYFTVDI